MCSEAVIRRFVGAFILLSAGLAWAVHPAWLVFTAFIGLNLLQSSVTGVCPLERILGHLNWFGCVPARQT